MHRFRGGRKQCVVMEEGSNVSASVSDLGKKYLSQDRKTGQVTKEISNALFHQCRPTPLPGLCFSQRIHLSNHILTQSLYTLQARSILRQPLLCPFYEWCVALSVDSYTVGAGQPLDDIRDVSGSIARGRRWWSVMEFQAGVRESDRGSKRRLGSGIGTRGSGCGLHS